MALSLLVVNGLFGMLHHFLGRIRCLVAHILQSFRARSIDGAAVQEDTDDLRESHASNEEVNSCEPAERVLLVDRI